MSCPITEAMLLETLKSIKAWIKDGGFIDDIHYDDKCILDEIDDTLKRYKIARKKLDGTMDGKMKIIIDVRGGVIQEVITDEECEVMVVDWDNIKEGGADVPTEFEKYGPAHKRFKQYMKKELGLYTEYT